MKRIKFYQIGYLFIIPCVIFLITAGSAFSAKKNDPPSSQALLPQLSHWTMTEEPANYFPENLFEFINGAAEIYLAYDFKELTVSQYNLEGSTASMAVEIYEMSNNNNAFGIYGAERYPDNNFVSIGIQGYVEEGVLNYLIGKYYVKLLCFEGSDKSEEYLELFAKAIAEKTQGLTTFPTLLSHFPKEGLVPNSEKFILKNVMGYGFLHDGYLSNYKVGDFEFDCFIIQGKNEEDAQLMLKMYLEAKKSQPIQEKGSIVSIKDRYYDLIYLSRVGSHICGVMKVEEGKEDIGQQYLHDLLDSFKKPI